MEFFITLVGGRMLKKKLAFDPACCKLTLSLRRNFLARRGAIETQRQLHGTHREYGLSAADQSAGFDVYLGS